MHVIKTIQLHSRVPLDNGPPENVSLDNAIVGEQNQSGLGKKLNLAFD